MFALSLSFHDHFAGPSDMTGITIGLVSAARDVRVGKASCGLDI